MSSSRRFPKTNIGRYESMLKTKAKKDSVSSADNILSAKTSSRLDNALNEYTKAQNAIIMATEAESTAMAAAIPQRKILSGMISHYVLSLNLHISMETIPRSARAFYGFDVNNDRTPAYNTDTKLIKMATDIINGDKERINGGGIKMTLPTIDEFTIVYDKAEPIIIALSNTKENLSKAKSELRNLNADTDDVLLHVSNEVETEYSSLEASTKRAVCRLWGVKYISVGKLSEVTGKCTDSISGLPLEDVEIKIVGSGKRVVTNVMGDFIDETSMYDDLELLATHPLYNIAEIAFAKENGVNVVVNVVMEKK